MRSDHKCPPLHRVVLVEYFIPKKEEYMEYLYKGEDFSKIKAGGDCGIFPDRLPADICPGETGIGYDEGGCYQYCYLYDYCSPTVNVKPCTELY